MGNDKQFKDITEASKTLQPGDTLIVYPGNYTGYHYIVGLHGTKTNWITIVGARGQKVELNCRWQFANLKYTYLKGLHFKSTNVPTTLLNIDNGGDCNTMSSNVVIDSCIFENVSESNSFKFGGVDTFHVKNCKAINNPGTGAGLALNVAYNGIVENCYFENINGKAIQTKLGTTNVVIRNNYIKNCGNNDVALKIGESGGLNFHCFNSMYLTKNIKVHNNIIIGGRAPFTFGQADSCDFINNTVIFPTNFVFRILPDDPQFVSKDNRIFNNIFYLDKHYYFNSNYSETSNLKLEQMYVRNNLFYRTTTPNWSGPNPNSGIFDAEELKGIVWENNITIEPGFKDFMNGDYRLNDTSKAIDYGIKIDYIKKDYLGNPINEKPSLGAIEYKLPLSVKEFSIDSEDSYKIFDLLGNFICESTIKNARLEDGFYLLIGNKEIAKLYITKYGK
jgi:hypothetical protein